MNSSILQERLAKYISIITSPFLIIFIFGIWIISAYSSTFEKFILFGTPFVILITFIPFLYISYGVKKGVISDIHMTIREQRIKPFALSILCSIVLVCIYFIQGAPIQLIALSLVLFIIGCFFLFTSFFSKISGHVASYLGSVFLAYRFLDRPWILLLLILFPLIFWARLKRKRHTIWQSFLAAIIVLIVISITLYLFGL